MCSNWAWLTLGVISCKTWSADESGQKVGVTWSADGRGQMISTVTCWAWWNGRYDQLMGVVKCWTWSVTRWDFCKKCSKRGQANPHAHGHTWFIGMVAVLLDEPKCQGCLCRSASLPAYTDVFWFCACKLFFFQDGWKKKKWAQGIPYSFSFPANNSKMLLKYITTGKTQG